MWIGLLRADVERYADWPHSERPCNVGGGFPAHYGIPVPPIAAYAEAIDGAITRHFGGSTPRLLVEPGRYMVGDAGILRSRILLVSRKSHRAQQRWVYIDAGRCNGLLETFGERIHYRLRTPHDGGPCERVLLAGPTCDSTDIIYQYADCHLPLELEIGDRLDFLSAGAYTASYASWSSMASRRSEPIAFKPEVELVATCRAWSAGRHPRRCWLRFPYAFLWARLQDLGQAGTPA